VDEADPDHGVALCSFMAGDGLYGIDARAIKEVLGRRTLRQVPLAPAYVGGIVPYRGEVLTTVSFRALLGLPKLAGPSYVIVLEDPASRERFGVMVDAVAGVIVADRRLYGSNPVLLDGRSAALYDGLYRLPEGLVIHLTPGKLSPARLEESGLFGRSITLGNRMPIKGRGIGWQNS
jgi:purine-binding chemotaxis protein CheW